jgi:hypothetical protein
VRSQEEKGKELADSGDVLVEKSDISWKQLESSSANLPSFDKKIAYYEIYSSSLHLCFFKVIHSHTSSAPQYELLSECFISLRKMMTLDYKQHK